VTFDLLASSASDDLACTAWVERSRPKLAGQAEAASMALRVTQIYRHEAGVWATVQAAETVLAAT
jgi:hypothetical protein